VLHITVCVPWLHSKLTATASRGAADFLAQSSFILSASHCIHPKQSWRHAKAGLPLTLLVTDTVVISMCSAGDRCKASGHSKMCSQHQRNHKKHPAKTRALTSTARCAKRQVLPRKPAHASWQPQASWRRPGDTRRARAARSATAWAGRAPRAAARRGRRTGRARARPATCRKTSRPGRPQSRTRRCRPGSAGWAGCPCA